VSQRTPPRTVLILRRSSTAACSSHQSFCRLDQSMYPLQALVSKLKLLIGMHPPSRYLPISLHEKISLKCLRRVILGQRMLLLTHQEERIPHLTCFSSRGLIQEEMQTSLGHNTINNFSWIIPFPYAGAFRFGIPLSGEVLPSASLLNLLSAFQIVIDQSCSSLEVFIPPSNLVTWVFSPLRSFSRPSKFIQ